MYFICILHFLITYDYFIFSSDQVKSGVPPRVVIDQLRNDFDNNVEKKNLTRKDVYNISSKYGLLHKYKLHAVDALSVDLQVKRYAETSLNPIIFYKTQGTEHFPLEVNDFMLIILTETQKEVLKKFGDQKLCIDCIYGPNQYNFNLTTILVIDEFGEGYPAAFCISTKIDEVHMMVFFSKLKEVIGCLAPNVFMSDDAPAFWNAWVKIMSSIPKFHLLCKWHVNNNWRKHLKKIDGAQMVKADIYKILHVLLEESDQTQFEFLLNSFLSKLDEEPVLHGFKAYFVSHYVPHKKLWAACYRHKVMIHNINVLEAFHKVLKHVYLKGKKNQRLDMLLWNLLKIVRDKNFERLIKLCDVGKVTHYLNAINDSHQSAVRILSSKIHKITNITWTVASESQEQDYLVTKLESCACKVICVVCDICVHSFKCTCYDYTIKNNMCKHIHAVQMNMSDDEESTQTVNINPIKTDEMCLKISSEQQLHKINLSLDSNLKVLFEEEGNVLVKNKN